ncbi:Mu transposase domain-containing protein [Kitasatospora indigofera]|uniref:Mu transposase domain-containing protein n=1 Tax=Kitasatospora indigofera TaxID=67307 RepID=UPI0036B3F3C7
MPDNLRTAVDRPDLYDPKINKSYAELATYYSALVDPARAAKPKDKPRVERPMPYVRDSFWSGREFTSVEQMQAEGLTWSAGTAGRRQCRPLGGASPLSVFEAVEAKALLPLPDKPFVLARWSTAAVGPDIHIKVGRTLYSVPWKLIGRKGRRPLHRHHGPGLPRGRAGQDPRRTRPGQAHGQRRLPAG